MPKGNTISRKRFSITIDPELNDKLNKYIVSQDFTKSKSYYIEQTIKRETEFILKTVDNQILDYLKDVKEKEWKSKITCLKMNSTKKNTIEQFQI